VCKIKSKLTLFIIENIGYLFENQQPYFRTGLNPKGPISIYPWETFYYLQRTLKKTDAEFVDLIHTAKAEIFPNTTGHVEFYPNRGETPQPGCIHVNFERDPFDKEIIECKLQ
jgi:hypothetical protein